MARQESLLKGHTALQGYWRPVLARSLAIAMYTALQALWPVSVDHCVLQRAALSQPGKQALPLDCFHAAELCMPVSVPILSDECDHGNGCDAFNSAEKSIIPLVMACCCCCCC